MKDIFSMDASQQNISVSIFVCAAAGDKKSMEIESLIYGVHFETAWGNHKILKNSENCFAGLTFSSVREICAGKQLRRTVL